MRMMKAFAYLGDGTAGWVEKPIPQPTGFDGVIRPLLVSPCTSDVHNVEIDCLKPGRILGHEGLGEIVAVGEGVKEFQVGEIVVVPPVTPDWRTVPSQLGAHQHCAGLITGQKLSNSEDGLLAEYALIRDLDANAARIPPGVSPEGAVMAADMLNTGLYGAELAEVRPGDTVVVMGVGPVGLMAIAGARLRGAGRIIAIGSRKAGVELARFYGATDLVNYKEGHVERQIYELTHKQGADCCICAGCGEGYYSAAVFQALDRAGKAPMLAGIDLSKHALRRAAKREKAAEFAVASVYALPVADEAVHLLLNCFSPLALEEFLRVLKPGGVYFYVVPGARHLWQLKEVLYDRPYPNEEKRTPYAGFEYLEVRAIDETIHLPDQQTISDLFQMTPYFWKTPKAGTERLAALDELDTQISFRVHVFRKQ